MIFVSSDQVDTVDIRTRSAIMSRVRSRGNRSTEKRLRACLIRSGVAGWVLHSSELVGRPDFVFATLRIAVFVDGCFWHACPQCLRMPQTNRRYWTAKIEQNRLRDRRISKQLRKAGWTVLRVWEHEVKARPTAVVRRILRTINR